MTQARTLFCRVGDPQTRHVMTNGGGERERERERERDRERERERERERRLFKQLRRVVWVC